MRVIKIKSKDEHEKANEAFYKAKENLDCRVIEYLESRVEEKGPYYNERKKDILNAITRVRKDYPQLNIDLPSFVLGIFLCETHPSEEGSYKILRSHYRQDKTKFNIAEVRYLYEILREL